MNLHDHYPPQRPIQDIRDIEQSRDDAVLVAKILGCLVLLLLLALFISGNHVQTLEDQISGIAYVSPEYHI